MTLTPKDRAAKAMGLAPAGLAARAKPGAVFLVKDGAIAFPAERLAAAGPRQHHQTRPAIVLQSRLYCSRADMKTVVVAPCSSSYVGTVGPWDMELPSGEAGLKDPRVVAFVSLAQPILKSELESFLGDLSPATLVNLQAVQLSNAGIATQAPEDITAP